jgi:hypothetical protein
VQVSKSSVIQNYYALVTSPAIFEDAIKYSAESSFAGVQGHLFVPSSLVELQQVIETIVIPVTEGNVWLGFSDEAVEGTFVIAAGPNAGADASEIISWDGDEPNGDRQENCVVSSPNFKWAVDAGCAFTAFYVIEYECPFGKRFNNQGTACIGIFLVCSLYLRALTTSLLHRRQLCLQQHVRGRRLVASPVHRHA